MAYISEFKTINNDYVKIEINGAGDGELTLSGNSPVTITYESDDIFKPLKMSLCTISILEEEPILSLYTGKINEISCKVFIKKDEEYKLLWYGFLTPNIYSQNYNQGYNNISLEFIDTISLSEYVKFNNGATTDTVTTKGMWWDGTEWHTTEPPEGFVKQPDIFKPGWNWIEGTTITTSSLRLFNTFFTYITDSIKCVDNNKVIKYIAVQNDVVVDIKEAGCLSRNYIDESGDSKDGAMTYKEVLESILGYISASLVYYSDTVYIINPLTLKNALFEIIPLYDEGAPELPISTTLKNLRDIGIIKANASISLGNVYNKITLRANNNPINSTIPELFNYDDLETIVSFNNQQYIIDPYITYDDTNGWQTYNLLCNFSKNTSFSNPDIMYDEDYIETPKYRTLNCVIERYAEYSADEPEPSSLSWKTCLAWLLLHMIKDVFEYPSINSWSILPITYYSSTDTKGNKYFIGKDGYLILDFKYKFSEINGPKENSHHNYVQEGTTDWYRFPDPYGHPHSTVRHNPIDYNWGVGKLNGNENQATWRSFKEQFPNNVLEDKIIETHKAHLIIGNKAWNGTEWVEYSSSYAGFQISTTLKYEDLIFGVEKHIDNNVSFTLHLADSRDGVIIPLPTNEVLQGDITFRLYPSSFFNVRFGSGNGGVPYHIIFFSRYATVGAEFITELSLTYTTNTGIKNIFNLDTFDPDIVYTNEINDDFVCEFDELELTTNTYSPYTTSTSFVMKQDSTGNKSYIEEVDGMKQEERIISKYYNYYSLPMLMYSNNLNNKNNTNITPFSTIHVETLNKDFVVDSLELDLKDNISHVNLKEI